MNTQDFVQMIKGNWAYDIKFYYKDERGKTIPLSYNYEQDDTIYKEKAVYFLKTDNDMII